jgi:hypothetical protein
LFEAKNDPFHTERPKCDSKAQEQAILNFKIETKEETARNPTERRQHSN